MPERRRREGVDAAWRRVRRRRREAEEKCGWWICAVEERILRMEGFESESATESTNQKTMPWEPAQGAGVDPTLCGPMGLVEYASKFTIYLFIYLSVKLQV